MSEKVGGEAAMNGKDVVLLSGGVDSAYLMNMLHQRGEHGIALFVDYGQPAVEMERRSADVLAKACLFDFAIATVHPMPLGQMGKGEGAHVVPARNLWLVSLAAAFNPHVWIGCAPQDERDYEDCRLHFLEDLDRSMQNLGKRLHWSNAPRHERVQALKDAELFDFCWSCYGPGPEACGECASCLQ